MIVWTSSPARNGLRLSIYCRNPHLHVSVRQSASHYDAIGLGVPTIILPFKTHEIVLPLQRAGHAWLARTPEDLVSFVRTWPTLHVPRPTSEHYFRPGAQRQHPP